jgi:hypothetical protein
MTETESSEPNPPRTLAEAGEALWRIRPDEQAPLAEWLTYYQRSAVVYDEIAEIDQSHHHEALYMAGEARKQAEEIEAQITTAREYQ